MPQHTQQSIAAVSARKFWQSTGSVLKSTGEENCMPGVGFKLIDSLLCLPSEFEDHTFCMVEYFKILPLSVSGPKIAYIQSIEIRLFGVFLYIKRSKKESTKSK